MIKVYLILIIIISSYFFALFLIKKLDNTTEQYSDLIIGITELKRQISLYKSESDYAFNRAFNIKDRDAFLDGLKTHSIYRDISNDDRNLIYEYFGRFGYGDSVLEIGKCDEILEAIKDSNKNFVFEKTRKAKLYKTLSVSFGLIISVLVI